MKRRVLPLLMALMLSVSSATDVMATSVVFASEIEQDVETESEEVSEELEDADSMDSFDGEVDEDEQIEEEYIPAPIMSKNEISLKIGESTTLELVQPATDAVNPDKVNYYYESNSFLIYDGVVTALAICSETIEVYQYDEFGNELSTTVDIVVTADDDSLLISPMPLEGEVAEVTNETPIIITGSENAIFYYTTDGTEPTLESNYYGYYNEIFIDTDCVIKAIAVIDDEIVARASQAYRVVQLLPKLDEEVENNGMTIYVGKTVPLPIVEQATHPELVKWVVGCDEEPLASIDNEGNITGLSTGTSWVEYYVKTANGVSLWKSFELVVEMPRDYLKVFPCDENEEYTVINEFTDIVIEADPCANVYYTLNGTEPTGASDEFYGNININRDSMLRAISVIDGKKVAEISQNYKVERILPEFSVPTLYLTEGTNLEIPITWPSAHPENVYWNSSDTDVFTLDEDGKITAVGEGNAILECYAYLDDQIVQSFLFVDVMAEIDTNLEARVFDSEYNELEINGIFDNSSDYTVQIDASPIFDLKYTVDGSEPKMTSEDLYGEINIYKTCTLKVSSFLNGQSVDTLTFNFKCIHFVPVFTYFEWGMYVDETINAPIEVPAAYPENLTWYSGDDSIATVDKGGRITGHSVGETYIYCSYLDEAGNEYTSELLVLVGYPENYLKLYPSSTTGEVIVIEDYEEIDVVASENATVYYTLDGSEPTTDSEICYGSIMLSDSGVLKLIAVVDGEVVARTEQRYIVVNSFYWDETPCIRIFPEDTIEQAVVCEEPTTVVIYSNEPEAEIYYQTSLMGEYVKYDGPFVVDDTVQIHAVLMLDGEIICDDYRYFFFGEYEATLNENEIWLKPGETFEVELLSMPTGVSEKDFYWSKPFYSNVANFEGTSVIKAYGEGTFYMDIMASYPNRYMNPLQAAACIIVHVTAEEDFLDIYNTADYLVKDLDMYPNGTGVFFGSSENAQVYFTLDGSDPRENGEYFDPNDLYYYNELFEKTTLTEDTLVRAISVVDGEVVAEKSRFFKIVYSKVEFERNIFEISVGESIQLDIAKTPEMSTDPNYIVWDYDDRIVDIKDGKVTGIAEGRAYIRCEMKNFFGDITRGYAYITVKNDDTVPSVSGTEEYTYTGETITVDNLVVSHMDYQLIEGTDYTVEYKNNKNVGKAQAIITLCGRYEGELVHEFDIKAADIERTSISNDKFTFIARYHSNNFVVKDGNVKLTRNKDYLIVDGRPGRTGDIEYVIEGIGNYSGTKTVSVEVYGIPKNIKESVKTITLILKK